MPTSSDLSPRTEKGLRLFEEGCLTNRATFIGKLREKHRSYHGILDARDDAAGWESQLAPPFVNHIVESTLASIVDGKLAYEVKPKPRFWTPDEFQNVQDGAKAHRILMGAQLKADRFHETQMPFALQDAIVGLTVAKTYWKRDVRTKPRLKVVPDPRAAEQGVFVPRLIETESVDICFDGPTTEVVNIEDFFWHEAATSIQASPVVAHRVWMHFSDLKRLEAQGVYKNVDELKDARGQGADYTDHRVTDGSSRSKDMLEVLEIWWKEPDGIYKATVGNRSVELEDAGKNPFWHGEYPFTSCSTRPNLFAIPGKSQVEKIADLQQARWDLGNQTQDNVRLLNNAIFMFGEDVTDPESYEFAPGARWAVEGDPHNMVMPWTPNAFPAEVALQHMTQLEQLMQNLAGGSPFTSTSEAGTANADTATQAALVTNIAQMATTRLKEQLAYAYERIGQQRMELNQQFVRVPMIVEATGLNSEAQFEHIVPYLLQGEYLFDVTPMVESLMRSERRAEANSMFQTFVQAAQIWMLLANAGAATPPNFDAFARRWLEGFEVGDTDQFFSPRAAAGGAAPAIPGMTPPGSGAAEPIIPPGITAPQATAPTSPSSQASLSAESHLARLGAMSGGVSNS